jgi:hypothetical protein
MRQLRFHIPPIHFHAGHPPREAHHHSNGENLERAEGVLDVLIIVGAALLAAVMIWGFFTSTGDQSWF